MENYPYSAEKFSARLKELRAARGMSQMALANATALSQSAIAKWEACRTEPTASAIVTLAHFFDEKIEYVLGLTE